MTELDNIVAEVQEESMPLSKEEFAAKKQAERDAAYALSDQTALEVTSDGGTFQQYLDLQGQLRHANPDLRNKLYSETNVLLVLAQKPDATQLGDYEYWQERGCRITSGPGSGIAIIERSKEYKREDDTIGRGYNVKKVFDISQVDARKLVQPPDPQYAERQLLKSLIAHAPVTVTLVDDVISDKGAIYEPQSGTILVQRGMEFPSTFRSLAEATATYYLTTGPDTQENPEFSAACTAYMLCKKYGVDTDSFWFDDAPEVFARMDAKEIKGELSQIRDVAADISMHMEKTLEPPNRGARTQDDRAR